MEMFLCNAYMGLRSPKNTLLAPNAYVLREDSRDSVGKGFSGFLVTLSKKKKWGRQEPG